MKDVRKLKLWHILENEGFSIKEIRESGILYGRGAILVHDYKFGFPYIEIKPLPNGHWRLTVDYFDHASSWDGNPFLIGKLLSNVIKEFKDFIPEDSNI